jgi:hypothetical protein
MRVRGLKKANPYEDRKKGPEYSMRKGLVIEFCFNKDLEKI